MSLDPRFLDELRARLAVSDVVGRAVPLQRAGREFKACCPFHGEKTPSFYVNDAKGFYHCFGCGAHGDIIGFRMRHDGLTFLEAVETLSADAGLDMPRPSPEARRKAERDRSLIDVMELAARYFERQLTGNAGREARAYLGDRGVSDAARQRFRLGYAPSDGSGLLQVMEDEGVKTDDLLALGLMRRSDRDGSLYPFFRGRLLFPVTDRRGRVIAFGGRLLPGAEGPKYINSPDTPLFDKGRALYGLAEARALAGPDRPVVLVEGYLDVIAMVEAEVGAPVAPLGTAVTEDQLQLLWRLAHGAAPVLCFDGDQAGLRAAGRAIDRALEHLQPDRLLAFCFVPSGEDPDSLVRAGAADRLRHMLDQAQGLFDTLWQLNDGDTQIQKPETRAQLDHQLGQMIDRLKAPALAGAYRSELRNRLWQAGRSRPRPANRAQVARRGPGRGPWQDPDAVRPQPVAPPPPMLGQTALRLRIALATLVNHPRLLDQWLERLFELPGDQGPLDTLREALLDQDLEPILAADDATAALRTRLTAQDFADTLAQLLGPTTYQHAGFARPGDDDLQAQAGLEDLFAVVSGGALGGDVASAAGQARGAAPDDRVQALALSAAARARALDSRQDTD